MLSFIRKTLTKMYSSCTSKLADICSRTTIDEQALKELEILLIEADTGVKTTRLIIKALKEKCNRKELQKGSDLKIALQQILDSILCKPSHQQNNRVYLLVGINGSGKTTFAGKFAHYYKQQNKKILLVAADTFRAAAPEQLAQWAKKSRIDIVLGSPGQDPASVVFTGCEKFKKEHYDVLIIDTAGRLQTKVNLMNELGKIKRIISKQLPDEEIKTLLTIDSMLGQNSLEQAKLFKECTNINDIVLTKMDGTAKGGIIFAIAQELAIPVTYITFGEQPDQFKLFDHKAYITELLN